MPSYSSEPGYPVKTEPLSRFYPNQESRPNPQLPFGPLPDTFRRMSTETQPQISPEYSSAPRHIPSERKRGDATYLLHRHPILLQRLYDAADLTLSAYRPNDFIYDAYPDYLSLHLMRDHLLRDNRSLTEEFLRAGCGTEWLNLLTDTVLSDLLCRKREAYRKPRGEASTTSVQFASLS